MSEHNLELDVSRGKIDVWLDGKPLGKIKGKIVVIRHDEMAEVYDNADIEARIGSIYHIKTNFDMSQADKMAILNILSEDSKVSS